MFLDYVGYIFLVRMTGKLQDKSGFIDFLGGFSNTVTPGQSGTTGEGLINHFVHQLIT